MQDYLKDLDRETLEGMLVDFAKNWLAHDGLWFLEVEKKDGMDAAIELDRNAWEQFTVFEARRIMGRHNIPARSGLEGLKKALKFRMYAFINEQSIRNETENSFEFYMDACRVQQARERKGLPLFPCRSVGIVEYREFAKTIDPRIETTCICCPPDKVSDKDFYCGWRFELKG